MPYSRPSKSFSREGPRRPYIGPGGFPKSGQWVSRPGYGRAPSGIRKFMKPKANAFGASQRGQKHSRAAYKSDNNPTSVYAEERDWPSLPSSRHAP